VHVVRRERCALFVSRHGESLVVERESDALENGAHCVPELFAIWLHHWQPERSDP
jgi:hypothetical protein